MKTSLISLALLCICTFSDLMASVDFTANKVCSGSYTTLVATSSYADSIVLFYKWDLNGDGVFNDATGKTISYLFAASDTFLVRVRVTTSDMVDHDMVTPKQVVVYPIPNANFQTDNLCETKTALFQSNSTVQYGSINQYLWDFNNDGAVDNNSGPSVSYNCGQASTFVTKLEVVSDQNCHSYATKTTQVFHMPDAKFAVQNACVGDPTVFTNQSTLTGENMLYTVWSFGDGQHTTTNSNTSHIYTIAGTYSAQLICVSENNCKDTFNLNVTANPEPTLTLNFSGDTVFYQGGQIQVTAMGTFENINWSTGEAYPMVIINQAGTYTVTASNHFGCEVQKSFSVQVIHSHIPIVRNNILTPNGDGINDVFYIENIGEYQSCKIEIYNSFGDKVFWSDVNYDNNWGGTLNGSSTILDTGAYYYYIQADETTSKGCINILRIN